jgi:hypothetical protein
MNRASLVLVNVLVAFLVFSFPVYAQISFFQPPTYSGTGTVFVADFNGDGKPDILTSDGTINLGNGDGTFKLGTSLSSTSVPVLAVADFNGDGKPDVLEQGTGTLLVLLGNGDGTFQAPIPTPSGASLGPVAAVDLNGDGKADVVGVFNSSLLVYISKGDGTFLAGVSYNLGAASAGSTLLSLGDFNGDSKTDVAVSIAGDNVVGQEIVLLGNGDGTFQTMPKTSVGVYYPRYAAVGDFNGDGKLDLAVSIPEYSTIPATTYVLLGNGDGTLQAPVVAFPGNGPLAAADLNADGKLDLVLVPSADPVGSQIYLGNGNGTFSNPNNYGISVGFASFGTIAIADFNGDGKLDIAAGGVLLGNGDGTFRGIHLGLAPGSVPTGAVVGDFEKKGALDVAMLSNQQIGSTYFYDVYILSNDDTGAMSLIHTYTLQQPGHAIVTADFSGDGNLDLMVVGTDPITQEWSYSVLLGNGDGSFQPPIFYPQSVVPTTNGYSIVVAEFNNDKKLDVAITSGNSSLALLLGNGDGTFTAPSYVFDAGASSLLSADFNGDGKLDIAAGGSTPSAPYLQTAILFGNGDGTFQPAVFPTSLNGFAAQFTADLNNDGKPDLVSFQPGQVALGNGDGTFTLLPALPYSVTAIADFNGDGKPDVLVTAYSSSGHPEQTGVLLGNGDGTFGPFINLMTSGVLASSPVLIADMNGDGRPDIVFPWENVQGLCGFCIPIPSGVGVLLNTTPSSFAISASALSPAPVTAGNSATSTVTVAPTFGFNSAVTLSCAGLPSGASCAFYPPSIANSSGTSTLTITTNTSVAAGTYAVHVQGTSGSIVNSTPVSLMVQGAPGFTISAASGSPTSQTISAGQTASFTLALAGTESFTGTVNLSCAITPTVTPAPSCTLSSSSVQISGSRTQSVTVKMGTTAPVTSSSMPTMEFPPGAMPTLLMVMLFGSTWLLARNRNRWSALAAPATVLAVLVCVSCGGNGSSSHTTPGTPTGTYDVAVTATSGSLSHNMSLTVVVQ